MHRAASLVSLLLASFGAACGSSDSNPPPGLNICPHVVYTGFVESSANQPDGDKYTVRVLVVGGSDLSWGTGNRNIATAIPDPQTNDPTLGLITAVGEGVTRVSAVNKEGLEGGVSVSVKKYPADSNLAGEALYMARPCMGCHDSPGQSNVTSSGVSDNTDDEVIAAFTEGKKPEGGMLNAPNHMFPLNDMEKVQMVSFLRSIGTRRPPGMDTCAR